MPSEHARVHLNSCRGTQILLSAKRSNNVMYIFPPIHKTGFRSTALCIYIYISFVILIPVTFRGVETGGVNVAQTTDAI